MRESLTKLRKGASPGTGGLRPEFLVTWGKQFNANQMSDLEDLAMRHVRGDLPSWWYTVWPIVKTVALYKDEDREAVRPLEISNPLIKSIHRETMKGSKEELTTFLEP